MVKIVVNNKKSNKTNIKILSHVYLLLFEKLDILLYFIFLVNLLLHNKKKSKKEPFSLVNEMEIDRSVVLLHTLIQL